MKTFSTLSSLAILLFAVAACSQSGAASTAPTSTPGATSTASATTAPSLSAPPAAAANIRTAQKPPDACMDALLGGKLVKHPLTGLGVEGIDGKVIPVEWPFGYSGQVDVFRVALLDETGKVVAHEGDSIQVGGGLGNQLWYACGPVEVTKPG